MKFEQSWSNVSRSLTESCRFIDSNLKVFTVFLFSDKIFLFRPDLFSGRFSKKIGSETFLRNNNFLMNLSPASSLRDRWRCRKFLRRLFRTRFFVCAIIYKRVVQSPTFSQKLWTMFVWSNCVEKKSALLRCIQRHRNLFWIASMRSLQNFPCWRRVLITLFLRGVHRTLAIIEIVMSGISLDAVRRAEKVMYCG